MGRELLQAARSLARRPGFTATVVLTLAISVGASAAIFGVVHAVLLRPLALRDPDRLVMLSEQRAGMETDLVSPITFDDWSTRSRLFEELTSFRYWENRSLEVAGGDPEPVLHITPDPNYFRVLGISPLFGRTHAGEKTGGINEAVLSYRLWQSRFRGDRNVLGRSIRISGTPFVVVGVMPPMTHDISIGWGDVWTPRKVYDLAQQRATSYRSRYLRVIGRLKAGFNVTQAQAAMTVLQKQLELEATSVAKGYAARVERLEEALTGRIKPALLVALGTVLVVLLTACTNIANLLLTRALGRERDMAIRAALGAGQWRLALNFLTESFLLAAMGMVAALAVAWGGMWLLKFHLAAHVPRIVEAGLSVPVLGFTLAIALVTMMLFSIAPLFAMRRGKIQGTLKDSGRSGGGGVRQGRLRAWLVAGQVAFAVVLLASAGLLLRSFFQLMAVDAGFQSAGRVVIDVVIPANEYDTDVKRTVFFRDLFRSLGETAGVESAGGALYFPCRGKLWLSAIWREGHPVPDGQEPLAYFNLFTGDYFKTMGIPLLKGRLLTEKEIWEPSDVLLINETMSRRLFPGEDPIGKRIKGGSGGAWRTIAGVVGDVRQKGLDLEPRPEFYVPWSSMPMPFTTIVARTSLPENAALAMLRSVVKSARADIAIHNLMPLERLAADTIAARRLALTLTLLFAAAALALAALGVYGVMSYAVSQRTAELGVRIALGASPVEILRLVFREGLMTALIGIVTGLAVALAVARLLSTLLYGVGAADWLTLLTVSLVALGAAALACLAPALRAMRGIRLARCGNEGGERLCKELGSTSVTRYACSHAVRHSR